MPKLKKCFERGKEFGRILENFIAACKFRQDNAVEKMEKVKMKAERQRIDLEMKQERQSQSRNGPLCRNGRELFVNVPDSGKRVERLRWRQAELKQAL